MSAWFLDGGNCQLVYIVNFDCIHLSARIYFVSAELNKEKNKLDNKIQREVESKLVLILTLQSQLEVTQFCIMFSCVCVKCCFAQEVYCNLIFYGINNKGLKERVVIIVLSSSVHHFMSYSVLTFYHNLE